MPQPNTPSLSYSPSERVAMASLTCASSCATVSVSSFRDNPSPSPSHSSLDSPSIYVTFKVLQLVHAFRRRVTRKHREQAASKKVSSARDFCQDFERRAYEQIDCYLGRKTRRPLKRRPRAIRNAKGLCHTVATRDTEEEPRKDIDRYVS